MKQYGNCGIRIVNSATSKNVVAKITMFPYHSIKFLGIIIDSSLTWNKNIEYTNAKLHSLGYIIRSLRSILLKIIK
jgi:hypothetical protein